MVRLSKWVGWLGGLILFVGGAPAAAQVKGHQFVRLVDSTMIQIVRLADGSTLIGRFIDVATDPLRFQTSGGAINVKRSDLREVKEAPVSSLRGGRLVVEDPNPTRLFFGPTARSLPRGEGDFSNTYLFLLSGSYGLGSNVQVGGGLSVFPSHDFSNNIFFVTAKAGLHPAANVDLAVGGLLGWSGAFGSNLGGEDGLTLGAAYGVGTFGTRDYSVTLGALLPFAGHDLEEHPVLLGGGEARLGKRIKLVTENYLSTEGGDHTAVFSYGIRIFGEKIAVDLAFLNSSEAAIFPGIPYVDFVVRF